MTSRIKAKNIFVYCQVFYPDLQSTSQLLTDAVVGLAGRGFTVTVIAGFPGLTANTSSPPACEIWRGLMIRRVGVRVSVKKSFSLRLLSYLSYSLGAIFHLLCLPRGVGVFVVTNPPFLPIIASVVCWIRMHSCKLMLQDIYPDGLVAVGKLRPKGVIAQAWAFANRWSFRRAAEIWVLGRDMVSLIQSKYFVTSRRIRCVPHWSPVEFPVRSSHEGTRLWSRLNLAGKFVVQYSGNMGLWHDIDTIVDAAASLRAVPTIHFLFIGAGMKCGAARRRSEALGLTNLTWLPYQPREALPDSLACCNVALISQLAGLEGIAVPCKLYGILGSGRAVVAQVPATSEVALVIREEKCGLVVAPGNALALASAVAALASNSAEVERMGVAAFAAYSRSYTLAAGIDAFDRGWRDWNSAIDLEPEPRIV